MATPACPAASTCPTGNPGRLPLPLLVWHPANRSCQNPAAQHALPTRCFPWQEGHPRHVNGDSEEGEEGEEGEGEGGKEGDGGGTGNGGSTGKQWQQAEEPAGPSSAAPDAGAQQGWEQRMAAMQAQLEEQGRLLREMAARLATTGGSGGSGSGGMGGSMGGSGGGSIGATGGSGEGWAAIPPGSS